MKTKKYFFEEVTNCEMCGIDAANHKVMGLRLNGQQGGRPGRKTGISVTVKKCRNCKLVFSAPQPIPFDIQDHYGVPPEDYWEKNYFEVGPDYFRKEIEIAKQKLDFRPGMKALDVGAGVGKGMLALKNAGFDAWGFEASKPFHDMAISKMGVDTSRLKLGQIEDLEYEENSFDFIVFNAVLEHFYHPANCIEKAMKWLKPGGVIFIDVPSSRYLLQRMVNFIYRVSGTTYVSNISPMHAPYHLYEFSRKSFEELGKKLNYTLEKVDYYSGGILFFPRFTHGLLRQLMRMTNTGMQIDVWLRKIK